MICICKHAGVAAGRRQEAALGDGNCALRTSLVRRRHVSADKQGWPQWTLGLPLHAGPTMALIFQRQESQWLTDGLHEGRDPGWRHKGAWSWVALAWASLDRGSYCSLLAVADRQSPACRPGVTVSREKRKRFAFDAVYGEGTLQQAVYEDTAPVVTSVLDGYNVCIFAYGQTGASMASAASAGSGGCARQKPG